MRQVPHSRYSYLLIGSGKLARHLMAYFDLLSIAFLQWDRSKEKSDLENKVTQVPKVLLAISDNAIEDFAKEHQDLFNEKTLIHFSGSLHIESIISIHPMMSFSDSLLSLKQYKEIPFNVFSKDMALSELLPELENPSFLISEQEKGAYHAHLAAISNLPQWIWAESSDYWKSLDFNSKHFENFLLRSFKNAFEHGFAGVTGPIARKDQNTINKNINDLKEENLKHLYKEFNSLYEKRIF